MKIESLLRALFKAKCNIYQIAVAQNVDKVCADANDKRLALFIVLATNAAAVFFSPFAMTAANQGFNQSNTSTIPQGILLSTITHGSIPQLAWHCFTAAAGGTTLSVAEVIAEDCCIEEYSGSPYPAGTPGVL